MLDFEEVYERWFDPVTRWIGAMGAPEGDLEDLAQDVFLIVRDKLPGFDGRNLPSWLYGIAIRRVLNYRRLAWFRSWFGQGRDKVELETLPDAGRSPADLAEAEETKRRLDAMLDQLSVKLRRSFVLYEIEGMSGPEIAELEKIPVGTVWTRVHLARRELGEMARRQRREGGA